MKTIEIILAVLGGGAGVVGGWLFHRGQGVPGGIVLGAGLLLTSVAVILLLAVAQS